MGNKHVSNMSFSSIHTHVAKGIIEEKKINPNSIAFSKRIKLSKRIK